MMRMTMVGRGTAVPALAMLFTLVACDAGGPPGTTPTPSASASISAPSPAPAPAPIAAPAPAASRVEQTLDRLTAAPRQAGGTPLARSSPSIMPIYRVAPPVPEPGPDAGRFANQPENQWQMAAEQPVSTFSLSTDTTSYNVIRRLVGEGRMPSPAMVRPEEFINAFDYAYAAPTDPAAPFTPTISVQPSPWDAEKRLLHIGLRTYAPAKAVRPRLNLVFLVDVSGSMGPADRLPMVQRGLRMMLPSLRTEDRISLVTYANNTHVVLDAVPGDRQAEIGAAIDGLVANGGTAGGAGLATAYDLAKKNRDPAAINRVVLLTDGDFNLGPSSPAALEEQITARRQEGIYLTGVGVGLGNLNDRTLHTLAKAGNGIAIYAGSLEDLRRGLVEDFAANIVPVADDVKLQVEFNPATVSQYRLIGYETRALRRQDFLNDKVDAGEIGSGRAVTALYEFVPVGAGRAPLPPLRYGQARPAPGKAGDEFAFLRIAYKLPGQTRSRQMERAVTRADAHARFEDASEDVRFATAVAGYAQLLRRSGEVGEWKMAQVIATADAARGRDESGRRAEFLSLARLTAALQPL